MINIIIVAAIMIACLITVFYLIIKAELEEN